MTIPAETPEVKRTNRPSKLFFQLALAITLFGLLLQMPCLTYDKVIDDFDLVYPGEQRGCGENPVDCFHGTVFQLYYRPLFTATFSVGDTLHAKAADRVNSVLDRVPRRSLNALVRRFHLNIDIHHRFEAHDAIWYHAENLALHVAVCGLGFWFFYLLFERERPALLAGLLFSLHPLQVTATTFIGGRPDSMALFFLLLFSIGAMNAAHRLREPDFPLRSFVWLAVSLFAFTCALFTKDQCAVLLPILPLLIWRPGFAFPLRRTPWLALYLPPIGLYVLAAHRFAGPTLSAVATPPWSLRLHEEMVGRTLFYFERLLFAPTVGPIHQSTLGPWDTPQPFVMGAGYLIAALWLAALWRFRYHPTYRFCAVWTSLALFPCLNLVPIPSQFASCYRAVIPLLGFAGLLGLGLDRVLTWWQEHMHQPEDRAVDTIAERSVLSRWKSCLVRHPSILGWTVIPAIFAFYTWETIADVPNWENNRTLMLAEVYGDPNFAPAFGGLGNWEERPHDDKAVPWNDVERSFTAVLDAFMPAGPADPAFVAAIKSKATQRRLWSHAGMRYEPVGYLLLILPHRGWARQQQGHFAAAADDYRHELIVHPDDDNSRANLRDCLTANGQVDEAISLYRSIDEVQPRSQDDTNGTTSHDR